MADYHIKLQQDVSGSNEFDLESFLQGFKFMRFENFEDVSENTALVIEEFADSNVDRVFNANLTGANKIRKRTEISMYALIFREGATDDDTPQQNLNKIQKWFEDMNKFYLWDDVRNVKQLVVFTGKVEVTETYYKQTPHYLIAKFEFKQIKNL